MSVYLPHAEMQRKKTGEDSMPDGDILHPDLSPRFRQLASQVCEGELPEDNLVRKALESLKKEVEFFGDEPLHLIARLKALFEDLFLRLKRGEAINWAHERREIKRQQQYISGHQRALGLVIRAGEEQLGALEKYHHYYLTDPDYRQSLTKQYLMNVYDAQFAAPLAAPLRPYPRQTEPEMVRQKLSAMRPDVFGRLESYVDQIIQHGTVQGLRRPPSRPQEKIRSDMFEMDISEVLRGR